MRILLSEFHASFSTIFHNFFFPFHSIKDGMKKCFFFRLIYKCKALHIYNNVIVYLLFVYCVYNFMSQSLNKNNIKMYIIEIIYVNYNI